MKKLERVICNSSPLIGLSILGLVHLLWDLFDEVFVTEAVYNEVVIEGKKNTGAKELKKAVKEGKIKIYTVQDEFFVKSLLGKLHKGELEVIAATKELNSPYLLIDDKAARSLAEALLLEPTGIIGLLKILKLSGKIDSLKLCLDELMTHNFRISRKLYLQLLEEVDEVEQSDE